jgi:hypothetical protein
MVLPGSPAVMTLTDGRLSNTSAIAGYVRRLAAGVLLHGLLRSHQRDPLAPPTSGASLFTNNVMLPHSCSPADLQRALAHTARLQRLIGVNESVSFATGRTHPSQVAL